MDKIVEIARFTYPADAQPLMALLRSEGIECYLRNELSSQIMAGYEDVGGARKATVPEPLRSWSKAVSTCPGKTSKRNR